MLVTKRPIEFDPSNSEHRELVKNFIKNNAWGSDAPKFIHDPKYASVAHMAQAKLLDWYLEQENFK